MDMDNSITSLTGSKMILDLVRNTRWTGMTQGSVKARERALRESRGYSPKREQFLTECAAIPRGARCTYVHPASTHTAVSYRREKGHEELTPAELVWLQRLPLDPDKVTHEDASRLAGMFSSLDRMKTPSSYQLVASIWGPVKEVHDLRAAKQDVENSRVGLPSLPNTALSALTEALAEEHNDWPESAVYARAKELLAQATEDRVATHAREVQRAESALQALNDDAAERRLTVKEIA